MPYKSRPQSQSFQLDIDVFDSPLPVTVRLYLGVNFPKSDDLFGMEEDKVIVFPLLPRLVDILYFIEPLRTSRIDTDPMPIQRLPLINDKPSVCQPLKDGADGSMTIPIRFDSAASSKSELCVRYYAQCLALLLGEHIPRYVWLWL
jgi:hypothetical protein